MMTDLRQLANLLEFRQRNQFDLSDTCPMCHHGIDSQQVMGYIMEHRDVMLVVCRCPRHACEELFIARYARLGQSKYGNVYKTIGVAPFTIKKRDFSERITELSKGFVTIYNQAQEAEKRGLDQICGVGYRKSLEFLIKDYLIIAELGEEDTIKHNNLGWVIQQYIDNRRIKEMAERAVWLGNDETHYERRWNDKDIADLKNLIELVVHYIDMEFIADEYMADMPKGKK